jgi:uridine phosphorylase
MKRVFEVIADFQYKDFRVGNLEMETSGIYLLAGLLGHDAISLNAIVANRRLGRFSKDPYATIDKLIQTSLRILSS